MDCLQHGAKEAKHRWVYASTYIKSRSWQIYGVCTLPPANYTSVMKKK